MKHIPTLLWEIVAAGLILFTASVYAASLEDEAKKVVMDYYINKKIGVVCGDSFYMLTNESGIKDDWQIQRFKEYYPFIASQQLTTADKLNGVEWKGSGALYSKANRVYSPKHGWSPWFDSRNENHFLQLTIIKEKGNWAINPGDLVKELLRVGFAKPIDCKNVEVLPK